MASKEIIGLFRYRLNIGTLELLNSGEYLFLINDHYRERLIADNFPFDSFFKQGETARICKTLPSLFTEMLPERQDTMDCFGITPADNEWQRLVKSAIHDRPKKDHTYILLLPVSTGERLMHV